MRGKLWFIGGLAAGFVLGARAGREKYEELVMQGRRFLDHPTVQEAAGVAQAQANRLYAEGKDRLSHSKLGEKLGEKLGAAGQRGGGESTASLGSATGKGADKSETSGDLAGSTAGPTAGSTAKSKTDPNGSKL